MDERQYRNYLYKIITDAEIMFKKGKMTENQYQAIRSLIFNNLPKLIDETSE